MEESTFLKYYNQEKENKFLKKFLDINRFSMAIKSKMIGDCASFRKYKKEILFENIGLKKKIILALPVALLTLLIKLKSYLATIGLGNSVFK